MFNNPTQISIGVLASLLETRNTHINEVQLTRLTFGNTDHNDLAILLISSQMTETLSCIDLKN